MIRPACADPRTRLLPVVRHDVATNGEERVACDWRGEVIAGGLEALQAGRCGCAVRPARDAPLKPRATFIQREWGCVTAHNLIRRPGSPARPGA